MLSSRLFGTYTYAEPDAIRVLEKVLLLRVGMDVIPRRISASSFDVPDRNALLMLVTAPPISILVRLLHPENALLPMLVTFGKFTSVSAAQFRNVVSGIACSSGADTL